MNELYIRLWKDCQCISLYGISHWDGVLQQTHYRRNVILTTDHTRISLHRIHSIGIHHLYVVNLLQRITNLPEISILERNKVVTPNSCKGGIDGIDNQLTRFRIETGFLTWREDDRLFGFGNADIH